MNEKNSGLEVVGYLRASVEGRPEWSEDCVCEQAIYPNYDGDESVSMPICRAADAHAVIAQRDARIAELESEAVRLGDISDNYYAICVERSNELAALKSRPSAGVALPEPFDVRPFQTIDRGSVNYMAGFNAAIRKMRESVGRAQQQEESGQ